MHSNETSPPSDSGTLAEVHLFVADDVDHRSRRQDTDSRQPVIKSESTVGPAETEIQHGCALVADLTRRQDTVLQGLDELNERIEAAIAQQSAARRRAQDASVDLEMETDSKQDDSKRAA